MILGDGTLQPQEGPVMPARRRSDEGQVWTQRAAWVGGGEEQSPGPGVRAAVPCAE